MMRRKDSFLFCLGVSLIGLTAACVDDPDLATLDDDIVGGTATTIDRVPWQVALTTT